MGHTGRIVRDVFRERNYLYNTMRTLTTAQAARRELDATGGALHAFASAAGAFDLNKFTIHSGCALESRNEEVMWTTVQM